MAAAAILTAASSDAQKRFAVIDFSAGFLREKPEYTSGLETQELMGTVVEILDTAGYWRQIASPQPYVAWCTDLGLVPVTREEADRYLKSQRYIYTSPWGRILSGPSESSSPVSDAVCGDILGKVTGKGGKPAAHGKWVAVALPSGKTGFVLKRDVEDFREWAESSVANASSIISTALQFAGTPYLWGGMSSKGLDCSGLTRLTWFLNGVLLPRNASQQVHTGDNVDISPDCSFGPDSDGLKEEMLRRVRNLQPGDLVFFGTAGDSGAEVHGKDRITHVGIYIGDRHIIHSSHTVRINSLIPGDPDYYENAHRLIRARRIIGNEDCGKGIVRIISSPDYFLED